MKNKPNHTWFNCDLCGPAVRCGTCGNNCCNATFGTVNGRECPDCESAYRLQNQGPPKDWDPGA